MKVALLVVTGLVGSLPAGNCASLHHLRGSDNKPGKIQQRKLAEPDEILGIPTEIAVEQPLIELFPESVADELLPDLESGNIDFEFFEDTVESTTETFETASEQNVPFPFQLETLENGPEYIEIDSEFTDELP